jgi:hypothetical protein
MGLPQQVVTSVNEAMATTAHIKSITNEAQSKILILRLIRRSFGLGGSKRKKRSGFFQAGSFTNGGSSEIAFVRKELAELKKSTEWLDPPCRLPPPNPGRNEAPRLGGGGNDFCRW